jgi:hypothetical protein
MLAKNGQVTGDWTRLQNEKLHDLYFSPNIIQVIELRRLRWTGHMACMKERRGAQRVLAGNARKTDHLDVLEIDGRIILKSIFRKWDGGHGLE